MKPETAMRQAGETAYNYFSACLKFIESDAEGKNISDECKFHCASRLALAASIDFATAQLGGLIDPVTPFGESGIKIHGGISVPGLGVNE